MPDEYIRLDTTVIAIDNLINEAATGTMARTLLKAKDTIYNQQRYVIDVQPVKHGEWKINSDGYYPYCSVCGTAADQLIKHLTKYCPECGARMDGGAENG